MAQSYAPASSVPGPSAPDASSWRSRRRRRALGWSALLLVLLAVVGMASISLGAVSLDMAGAFRALFSTADPFARVVVWEIRFPRFLDAVLLGAALAVAGALLQVVTRNPLADPTILGVSSAAGLAVAVGLVVAPGLAGHWLAALSVGGGLVGAAILLAMAWRGVVSPIRLTLAGVALAAFFGAAIVGLLASSRTFLELSLGFLAGGLYGADWRDFRFALPVVLPAILVAMALASRLNAIALGDELATGLGVLADRTRFVVLFLVGVLAGVAVSIAGLVSFVGLVSPHVARGLVGDDQRYLIPVSALTGALLVAAADLAARLLIRPGELPMGVLTAAVGAPFLLYLVRFRR